MTGHEPPNPDVTPWRRVQHLRTVLGLAPVPPHVGAELETVAAVVSTRVQARMRECAPGHPTLSADEQRRLHDAVARAVEEFARIVESRPLSTPRVAEILSGIACDTAHPKPFSKALHDALEALRVAMRESWSTLRQACPHTERLDAALARYVDVLLSRASDSLGGATAGADLRRAEQMLTLAMIDGAERRWHDRPVQLCIGIRERTEADDIEAGGALTAVAQVADPARLMRLIGPDHVVLVIPGRPRINPPGGPARSTQTSDAEILLWGGPVSLADLTEGYATALLLYRLIRAGVAPPTLTLIPLPRLGVLRARSSPDAVAQIAELLEPLTRQPSHRRFNLGRTLRVRLQTGGTAQAMASDLKMHPQSVRNHLGALRELFDNPDLDFGQDALAMLAALDLVLPLWEVEATGRHGAQPARRRGTDAGTPPKPPREGEILT